MAQVAPLNSAGEAGEEAAHHAQSTRSMATFAADTGQQHERSARSILTFTGMTSSEPTSPTTAITPISTPATLSSGGTRSAAHFPPVVEAPGIRGGGGGVGDGHHGSLKRRGLRAAAAVGAAAFGPPVEDLAAEENRVFYDWQIVFDLREEREVSSGCCCCKGKERCGFVRFWRTCSVTCVVWRVAETRKEPSRREEIMKRLRNAGAMTRAPSLLLPLLPTSLPLSLHPSIHPFTHPSLLWRRICVATPAVECDARARIHPSRLQRQEPLSLRGARKTQPQAQGVSYLFALRALPRAHLALLASSPQDARVVHQWEEFTMRRKHKFMTQVTPCDFLCVVRPHVS